MFIDGSRLNRDVQLKADVCVIGSGAGGAPLAYHLSKKGFRVIMVEEGDLFTNKDLIDKPSSIYLKAYRDKGVTATANKPNIIIPFGKTVGGTTTINSGTCFRIPQKVVDSWNLPIDKEELDEAYMEVEKELKIKEADWNVLGRIAEKIKEGADKLGYSNRPLRRNADGCIGLGLCVYGCPVGAKTSTRVTYIPWAVNEGMDLYYNTRAIKLWADTAKINSVDAVTVSGIRLNIRADVFVVSCGAILTPVFLYRSGLRNPFLGKNLTIHPAAKLVALYEEQINGWDGIPQGYCIDHFADEGIMFEGAFLPPDNGSVGVPGIGTDFMRMMENYNHIATFGFMISDPPSGRVIPGPFDSYIILYKMKKRVIRKIKKACEILAKVFFASGAREVLLPISGAITLYHQDQVDVLKYMDFKADDLELMAFHPLGTCRMGIDTKSSVIDIDMRVHDTTNLFVVDGSIFPSSLGVNPQQAIMAFSKIAARRIEGLLKRGRI